MDSESRGKGTHPMADERAPVPEISRVVNLDELPAEGSEFEVVAVASECVALAARFGVASIDSFRAAVRLMPVTRGAVRFSARLRGTVTQTCVVSLEPVDQEIDEDVTILFRPRADMVEDGEVVLDLADETEPMTGDELDIGEIVAEELALALDPYPRKAGLDPHLGPHGEAADARPAGPFDALAALKRKKPNH